MKPRIAKKILLGRSGVCLTEKRVMAVRSALAKTKFNKLAKVMLFGYLYGGSPCRLRS